MRWKWLFGFVLFAFLHSVKGQDTTDTLSLSFKDLPLEIVLDSITYKSGYYFSYNADAIPKGSLYTLTRKGIHIDNLLNILLVGTMLEHSRYEDQIIIRAKQGVSKEGVDGSRGKVQITGWVREYRSKNAIEGVNVFINGTTIGTVTDQYGNYRLTDVPHGSYILVFSHVAYELASYSFKAENNNSYAINGLLDFKVRTLDQIEIISDPIVSEDEWPRYYRMFKKEFLGSSANASRCEILNAESLDFSYNEDTRVFTGEAQEPLIILNEALGYQVSYELEHFERDDDRTSFYGKARFTPLDPENNRIRKKWRKNRMKSYYGSITHFFKSLIADELKEEGFRIYSVKDVSEIFNKKMVEIEPDDILARGTNRYEWKLDFDDYVMVSYDKEVESTQYLSSLNEDEISSNGLGPTSGINSHQPGAQKSMLELKRTYVTLDHNGQIKEPLGLTTIGYWSWERVADLMPADYDPKADNL